MDPFKVGKASNAKELEMILNKEFKEGRTVIRHGIIPLGDSSCYIITVPTSFIEASDNLQGIDPAVMAYATKKGGFGSGGSGGAFN